MSGASRSKKETIEAFKDLNYEIMDPKEHILRKPGMYIGEIKEQVRKEWVFNPETKELFEMEVSMSGAMIHLFIEVLMNAADNIYESRLHNIDPGKIEVEMDNRRVRVKNYGRPIPVQIHPKYGIYNPLVIFGNLLSSSHYDDSKKRFSCGTHGLGAKLTNVWSKFFRVSVEDSFSKKSFDGIWRNNMKDEPEFTINKYKGSVSSVEVEWETDFERFGLSEFPLEAAGIFSKYLISVSVAWKIPVVFNGFEMDFSNALDFCRLYWKPELVENAIIYRQYEDGTISMEKDADYSKLILTELIYLDTPNEGLHLSFANAMNTINGGAYVDTAFSVFSTNVLPLVKQSDVKLTVRDIKAHTSIFLNCLVEKASYLGQMKEKLSSPNISISPPPKFFNPVKKWNLILRLKAEIQAKQFLQLKKTDSKKLRYTSSRLEDANMVFTKPQDCNLFICEGDSASGLPRLLMAYQGGHDLNGIMTLNGKILNVRNAEIEKIKDSEAIVLIKKALNLQEGTDYTLPENKKKLKYGLVTIATDADDDGKHICGLLINYFNIFYPSLLKVCMIGYLRLAVVKAFRGKNVVARFYSLDECDKWIETNKELAKKCSFNYYKGLGSYEKEEVEDDIEHTALVLFDCDEEADVSLDLAFNKEKASLRKKWMVRFRKMRSNINYEIINSKRWRQSITSFVNNQMIDYSLANLRRSIPGYIDGFKNVQAKIITASLERWKWKYNDEKVKVSAFAGRIMEKMGYHHGSVALEESIKKMAFDFVGSNNLPLLKARSMMGSRNKGGQDSPEGRYAFITLAKWTPYIFRRELQEMIPKKIEDGEKIEFERFIPIIPMALVNKNDGIATGYSTQNPCYNPHDLIKWIRDKNSGISIPETPKPYYHGFTGATEEKLSSVENEILLSPQCQDFDEDGGVIKTEINPESERTEIQLRHITYGTYKIQMIEKRNNTTFNIIITELPVGVWTLPYYEHIQKQFHATKLCKDIRNLTDEKTQKPYIFIEDSNIPHVSPQTLFLVKSCSLQNITFLDKSGWPKKYTIPEVLQRYYEDVLDVIKQYRKKLLREIQEDIKKIENKIKFITAVIEGKIKTSDNNQAREQEDVLNDMIALNIEYAKEILESTKFSGLTRNKLDKFIQNLQALKENYQVSKNKTPEMMWEEYLQDLEKVLPY